MQKRLFIFFVFTFLILLVWFFFYPQANRQPLEKPLVKNTYLVKKKLAKSYVREASLAFKRSEVFFAEKDAAKAPIRLSKKARSAALKSKIAAFKMPEKSKNIPIWKKNALPFTPKGPNAPKIALIIDDLGLDLKQTKATLALDGPLILSFMAYGEHLNNFAEEAKMRGHEVMLHLPMQPVSERANAGPNALKIAMSAEALKRQINLNLDAFEGYVAVNNHMGSLFTANEEKMAQFFALLKKRDVFFIDSKTSEVSVCESAAKRLGVPILSRDIFIDHVRRESSIRFYLEKLERKARENGSAIGIGHPSKITLKILAQWIPTLKKKRIELVPVSYLMEEKLKKMGA